jgi:hypothetical protein
MSRVGLLFGTAAFPLWSLVVLFQDIIAEMASELGDDVHVSVSSA